MCSKYKHKNNRQSDVSSWLCGDVCQLKDTGFCFRCTWSARPWGCLLHRHNPKERSRGGQKPGPWLPQWSPSAGSVQQNPNSRHGSLRGCWLLGKINTSGTNLVNKIKNKFCPLTVKVNNSVLTNLPNYQQAFWDLTFYTVKKEKVIVEAFFIHYNSYQPTLKIIKMIHQEDSHVRAV